MPQNILFIEFAFAFFSTVKGHGVSRFAGVDLPADHGFDIIAAAVEWATGRPADPLRAGPG